MLFGKLKLLYATKTNIYTPIIIPLCIFSHLLFFPLCSSLTFYIQELCTFLCYYELHRGFHFSVLTVLITNSLIIKIIITLHIDVFALT